MSSVIKDKAARGASKVASKFADTPETLSDSSSSGGGNEEYGEKYILRVTAGPSYDPGTHVPIIVNGNEATAVENEFMKAKVKVRIRGYRGLPRTSPSHTPYFDHPMHSDDQYSVGFSFVPKIDLPGDELWWGNDFDHPIRDRLPPGFNFAFNIAKNFIDRGIEADAYSDKPWLYAPALDCWFTFRIGDKLSQDQQEDIPHVDEEHPLQEGADGTGVEIRERLGIPPDSRRRKFYLSAERRAEFVFEKNRLYQGDFFNPYLDFNKFALRLPGFSLRVIKYINDKTHNLRYVFKNRRTGDVYFVVNIALLFGEDLRQALQEDDQRSRQASTMPSPITSHRSSLHEGESITVEDQLDSPAQDFFDAKPF